MTVEQGVGRAEEKTWRILDISKLTTRIGGKAFSGEEALTVMGAKKYGSENGVVITGELKKEKITKGEKVIIQGMDGKIEDTIVSIQNFNLDINEAQAGMLIGCALQKTSLQEILRL